MHSSSRHICINSLASSISNESLCTTKYVCIYYAYIQCSPPANLTTPSITRTLLPIIRTVTMNVFVFPSFPFPQAHAPAVRAATTTHATVHGQRRLRVVNMYLYTYVFTYTLTHMCRFPCMTSCCFGYHPQSPVL